MEQILNQIRDILDQKALIKIVFSNTRKKSLPCKKITIRPVLLHGELKYQAEFHYADHVTHENLTEPELLSFSAKVIESDYKQINLLTESIDIQILASNPEKPKIVRKSASREHAAMEHNHVKHYIIPDQTPCDFLIQLGVMDQNGKVFQKHYSKFRQINRFLEIVRDVSEMLPASELLRIVDFGCGKSYLTFALYHYLRNICCQKVSIVGLDLKESVIRFCNEVAKTLHYDDLTFQVGDIADYDQDCTDMVVTLHACDTATDLALIHAVRWRAKAILSVPCCQHELFEQIENDLHQPLLKHGILKDRFTEILTDGLRGLKLESCGYDVSMIEFTSLEHTSRNIMIKAVLPRKTNTDKMKKAQDEYERLTSYWHVHPTIDFLSGAGED